MKLKTELSKKARHNDLMSGVSWGSGDEVFTTADDHLVLRLNIANDESGNVCKLPDSVFPTDMEFTPKAGAGGMAGKKQSSSEAFVLTSTDGKIHLITRTGRIEKSIEGHRGAVLAVRWSHDGSALASSGEDGAVKVWSKSVMLRSTLSQNAVPVYGLAWGPDSDRITYTLGKQLVIKSMQTNAKPTVWKAHDGLILKVDWSPINNNIISGGEDCKYKVWDAFGRLLYCSSSHDYPITSIRWAPDGEVFAVGSFNTLRLCDQTGWSHSLDKPNTGSIMNVAWSADGTQLACAGSNGYLLIGHVIDRRLEWLNFEVSMIESKVVSVRNVSENSNERLDFRDRIVKFALDYHHLLIVTTSQCHVYSTKNWNTPTIIDLKGSCVTLVVQAERHFALVDANSIYVYSYDGRMVCAPKYSGMRCDFLHSSTLSLSNDTLAIRDKTDERVVYLFDATSGKPLGDGKPVSHKFEVCEIALDKAGSATERKLAIIDKNRDLYLISARIYGTARKFAKLATMALSMAWNDSANMLAAICNAGQLRVWYYPHVAMVDKELLSRTAVDRPLTEIGKQPHLVAFHGFGLSLRLMDGSLVNTMVSPHPAVLHNFVGGNKWTEALRYCRYVKDPVLWACLAGMATNARDLNTAEAAYAAIDEIDKVQYIQYIRELPLKEARNAEMLLLSGNQQDAEGILLQSGLVFRAIMLNITLYNWDRALELAVKHKTNVDTVLAFRMKYMDAMGRKESNKKFLQYADQVEIEWEKINAKIALEYQKEKERPAERTTSRAPSSRGSAVRAGDDR